LESNFAGFYKLTYKQKIIKCKNPCLVTALILSKLGARSLAFKKGRRALAQAANCSLSGMLFEVALVIG
jgi:hypothetical protein